MTLALQTIDLTISDDVWLEIDAYATELHVSPDRALDQLLEQLLVPVMPQRRVMLMCEGCAAVKPHIFIGAKLAGTTAREQLYRCGCGRQRRYGLVT